MTIGGVPADSGLPRLRIPVQSPKSRGRRLILAVVLHVISGRRSGYVSQRELQARLNRAGRDSVQNHLYSLRTERFLRRVSRRRSLTEADSYALGSRLSSTGKAEWSTLANQLFGKAGFCRTLLGRPAFGTGFLGLNSMLIIGVLRRSKCSLTVRELHQYLEFFISAEKTVRSRLLELERHQLVIRHGSQWELNDDALKRLVKYEESSGASARAGRVSSHHRRERDSFSIRLRKGVLTSKQEDDLRDRGCIRCRRTNDECIDREGLRLTIEHFPPKEWLKQWGLNDHPHFNWAICPSENSFYGGHLARVPVPALDEEIRMTVRGTRDAGRIAIAKLEVELRRFYRSIDTGRPLAAAQAAKRAASLWRALLLEVGRAELSDFKGRRIAVSDKHAKLLRSGSRRRRQSVRGTR
jgi:hypothetical protein